MQWIWRLYSLQQYHNIKFRRRTPKFSRNLFYSSRQQVLQKHQYPPTKETVLHPTPKYLSMWKLTQLKCKWHKMRLPWHYTFRIHHKEFKNLVSSCKNFQLLLHFGSPLRLSGHVTSVLFQALFLRLKTILLAGQVCTCIPILTWQEEYLCYVNKRQLETLDFQSQSTAVLHNS
jgi:hypothetical protein